MPEGLNQPHSLVRHRKRLAIVSSWNDNCGNASYTNALKKQFEKHYDVEILALDLFVIQRRGKTFSKIADDHFKAIANQLRNFDYVNIQFEAGLYGATIPEIRKHVQLLIDSAPNLIFTMHRLDMLENSVLVDLYGLTKGLSLSRLIKSHERNEYARLCRDLIMSCVGNSRAKNVWIKVHTKRERRLVSEAFKFENCIDYPLCYLDHADRASIWADRRPGAVQQRYALPAEAKVMGAFGYISNYKGFETLIRAVSVLPREWYLLIVGSQHPQSVRPWVEVDPYLAQLVKEIERGGADARSWLPKRLQAQLRFSGKIEDVESVRQMARGLLDRVRFVGNVGDDEFTFLLRNVDAAVLPYLEVGQSMSGVIALAVESGARLFCSNTLSFNEARRYYGRAFSTFDIGNYVEVAQRVQFDTVNYDAARDAAYEVYNIVRDVALQRHIFERGHLPPAAMSEREQAEMAAK